MPHHCAVPLCTSNSKTSPSLSFHKFPKDSEIRATWIRNIRRDEVAGVFVVNDSTRVCSLHFLPSDYHDASEGRKRERSTQRKNKFLKAAAAPTQFDCFPERLRSRSTDTTRKRRPPARSSAPLPAKKRTCARPSSPAAGGEGSTSAAQEEAGCSAELTEDSPEAGRDDSSGDRKHAHCECVPGLVEQVEQLTLELQQERAVSAKLREDLEREKQRRDISFERHQHDDGKIRHYTGFPTLGLFLACFHFLLPSAKVMRTWQGRRTSVGERLSLKSGPKPKLSYVEQFFMVMLRLRRAYSVEDLSDLFHVSESTISRTFTTWINLMFYKFKELPMWMSRRKVDKYLPPCFQRHYPSTRVIIDATEFFIETPSSLVRQSTTWSSYKYHNTFKTLVGISPDGTITFISDLYEGSMSDVELVEQCGILAKLERGDSVMADKGFDIQHLLSGVGVRLNIPPFRQGERQFTPDQLVKTKKIAAVRIHVERAIKRLKEFKLISYELPNTLWDMAEHIIVVAAHLCNFQPGLVG